MIEDMEMFKEQEVEPIEKVTSRMLINDGDFDPSEDSDEDSSDESDPE